MLSDRKDAYEKTGETLYVTPAEYKKREESKWLSEIDALALCNVQMNLNKAYSRFFDKISDFPKFKKKGYRNSYTTNYVNNNIKLDGDRLTLPKIPGQVKIVAHRKIEDGGKIKSVTITREPNDKYYASILFEFPLKQIKPSDDINKSVGLDMKLRGLYVSSNKEEADYPCYYRKNETRLAWEQRKLSRKKKDSNNYEKQRKKVAKVSAKTKHQRNDFLHKKSSSLANTYDYVFIEDLDMHKIVSSVGYENHGKSAYDIGWGTFTSMLAYKMVDRGAHLIKVSKWFPSSKTCCECGHVYHELKKSDRTYVCPHCGNVMDRDYQAAINIKTEGLRMIA